MLRFRGWGNGAFVVLIPCILLTAFYQTWTWTFITVFYMTLLVMLFGRFLWQGKHIDVQQRVVHSEVIEGDKLDIEVTVKLRRAGMMWFGLQTADHRRMFFPGQKTHIHYRYTTNKLTLNRGKFELPPLVLEGGDALGWFSLKREFYQHETFWVYPRPELPDVYRSSWKHQAQLFSDNRSLWQWSRDGELRQFKAGDPLRYVDWKATARSENMYVRERPVWELNDGWIVVPDGGWGQRDTNKLQEKALRMAAALMTKGPFGLPGLLTCGRRNIRFVLPEEGTATERMRHLAEWNAASAMKLAAVLSDLRRPQYKQYRLLVITPRLSPALSKVLESYVPGMVWQLSSSTNDLRRLQQRGWVTIGPDEKVVDSHAN